MRERRFSRIVNITSAMVTTPDPFMAASSGARTGTMAVMKGLQRQTVPDNVMINQLFPERIDSGRQLQMARIEAERDGVTVEEARLRQAATSQRGGSEARRVRCRLRVPVQRAGLIHLRRQPQPGRRQLRTHSLRRRATSFRRTSQVSAGRRAG